MGDGPERGMSVYKVFSRVQVLNYEAVIDEVEVN